MLAMVLMALAFGMVDAEAQTTPTVPARTAQSQVRDSADVALDVVRSFTDRVREKSVGAAVLKSIKPGQMVVKIVHDELVAMLGTDGQGIDLNAPAPVIIMMVGLQGSGKTTTAGKLARRLMAEGKTTPVSYTHLTLPTKRIV